MDQLLNKVEDLKVLIASNEPDIIFLSEVIPKAQKNEIHEAQLNIPGYDVFPNFSSSEQNLGASGRRGVAIYVKDSLDAEEVKFQTDYTDHMWVEIKLRNKDPLLCGCIYRSPSKDKDSEKQTTQKVCELIIEAVGRNNSRLLICGDFNYPDIDWECQYSKNDNLKVFLQTIQELNLHQHVCNPTRYRDGHEPSLLDLIITTEEGMINFLEHNPGLGESDHECLNFGLNCFKEKKESAPHPNYYKADYETIIKRLERVNWTLELKSDFNQMYRKFLSILLKAIEDCIPQKPRRSKKKNIYMTRDTLKLKDLKAKLWKRYKSTNTYYDRERYRKVKNELRATTRHLRKEFERNLAKNVKDQPKKFWAYVNSRTKTRSKIPPLQTDDGGKANSAAEKAEALNNFFSSVFTDESLDNIPDEGPVFRGDYLDIFEITPEMVLKKLQDLNPNKTPGPDGWHPYLLKQLASQLATPLSILFQKSLSEGNLPDDWLAACITAIHKKGDKSLPGNYRPISMTSILCKIMESLVRDNLVEHMERNGLFSAFQHGFVPLGDCLTNLLVCIEKWVEILEANDCVDVVYTDFSKAFDSVPHQRLLRKLKNNGIIGRTLAWIESFLSNRQQQVRVDDEYSSWKPVKSGIPQGSVLGPILFVIFINDMPEVVQSICQLFADDAKIFDTVNLRDLNSGNRLQEDINAVSSWSSRWQLPFNVKKCKVLHIGNTNPCRRYKMNNHYLDDVEEEKDLGVLMDSELKFHKQTAAVVKNANSKLGLIRKSFASLDEENLPLLFKSLVRSKLEYGNLIWGPFFKEDAKAVERVQRRATRMVPTLRQLEYADRLQQLNLPSMHHRRRRGDMIFAYKIMTEKVKIKASDLFTLKSRTLRAHELSIQKKKATKLLSMQVFSNRIVNDWNNLPKDVVMATSTNAFKAAIDEHWKEEMFQTAI